VAEHVIAPPRAVQFCRTVGKTPDEIIGRTIYDFFPLELAKKREQDDLSVIPRMLDLYCAGNNLVYGVRRGRDADTLFKRLTAETYYRLMRWMGRSM